MSVVSPVGEVVSPDGLWRWDGVRWVPQAPPSETCPPYRSARMRARLVVRALAACVAVEVFSIVVDAIRIGVVGRILAGDPVSDAEATRSDTLVQLSAVLEVAALVVVGIFFLTWLYRAVANSPALGAKALQYSPRGAVGWWFVPFVNLVRPFRVVAETWSAARPTTDGSTPDTRAWAPVPVLLRVWWALWLLAAVMSRISFFQSRGDGAASLRDAAATDILASAVEAGAAIACALVVWLLTARQERAHAARVAAAETYPVAPTVPEAAVSVQVPRQDPAAGQPGS